MKIWNYCNPSKYKAFVIGGLQMLARTGYRAVRGSTTNSQKSAVKWECYAAIRLVRKLASHVSSRASIVSDGRFEAGFPVVLADRVQLCVPPEPYSR
ncbi:unnamed protein product, partial [Iphiclides podalirius]